ncbi:MAG: hypothetical protein K1X92_05780 [Bacteroidia bacterium]|nr:hypothetical protein [Bacteroidia bacterium]
MKFIIKTTLITISALLVSFFLPWWGMCIPAFIIPFFFVSSPKRSFSSRKKEISGLSFLSGFIAGLLVWGGAAAYQNYGNGSVLGKRIAELITQSPQPIYAILISAVLGGLICAFPAMTGAYLATMLKEKK